MFVPTIKAHSWSLLKSTGSTSGGYTSVRDFAYTEHYILCSDGATAVGSPLMRKLLAVVVSCPLIWSATELSRISGIQHTLRK